MRGALDVHRSLLTADIPHEIVRLRRMVLSADELPEALGLAPTSCVAVHVYAVSGGRGLGEAPFVAVAVSAGVTPDPTSLLEAIDATSVRAATPAEVNAVTDYTAGLVPPVALPSSLPLLLDAELGSPPVLYTATGEVGTALGISARHLLTYTNARVASLTRPPTRRWTRR